MEGKKGGGGLWSIANSGLQMEPLSQVSLNCPMEYSVLIALPQPRCLPLAVLSARYLSCLYTHCRESCHLPLLLPYFPQVVKQFVLPRQYHSRIEKGLKEWLTRVGGVGAQLVYQLG
jgi:hypothetical protein